MVRAAQTTVAVKAFVIVNWVSAAAFMDLAVSLFNLLYVILL